MGLFRAFCRLRSCDFVLFSTVRCSYLCPRIGIDWIVSFDLSPHRAGANVWLQEIYFLDQYMKFNTMEGDVEIKFVGLSPHIDFSAHGSSRSAFIFYR